ncbi:MAG: class I SAM-dependent methyltransferase [Candidatus Omnitrophica bacterium]|nr:class I SAM-dependent methyltransferase [Candidatus Omnitrophota bacterium]
MLQIVQKEFWKDFVLPVKSCPLCGSKKNEIKFIVSDAFINLTGEIVKCKECSFVYSGSQLSNEAYQIYYNHKYKYSNYSFYSVFSEIRKNHYIRVLNRINSKIDFNEKRLLDLGCGNGILLEIAKSLGFEVVGVDLSEEAIKMCKSDIDKIYCCDLNHIDTLNLGKFDVITLFDVLDHVKNPNRIVELVYAHLKIGGLCYIEVNNINSFYAKLMRHHNPHLQPYEHQSYFSVKTLKKLLEEKGFSDVIVWSGVRKINYNYLEMTMKSCGRKIGRLFRVFNSILLSIS